MANKRKETEQHGSIPVRVTNKDLSSVLLALEHLGHKVEHRQRGSVDNIYINGQLRAERIISARRSYSWVHLTFPALSEQAAPKGTTE